MSDKPLPDITDPEYAPYWEACRQGRLVVQACVACGRRRWPPRPSCGACLSLETTWVDVPMSGRLYSWVNVWRPGVPGFESEVPYVVAVVEVDPTVPIRFLGNVVDARSADLAIGADMDVVFRDVAPGTTMPYWRLAARAPASRPRRT